MPLINFFFKGVLHLLPKISMFCALSQNNQQLFEKIDYASYKKIVQGTQKWNWNFRRPSGF